MKTSSTNQVFCNLSIIASRYKARVDILQKQSTNNTWNLFLIKLSTKYKVKYVNEASFIAMVLEKTGMKVIKTTILYISKNYRFGMHISKLFISIDCTEAVNLQKQNFFKISDKIIVDLKSRSMPHPYLKSVCKHCHIFQHCVGKNINRHIFDIPDLSSVELENFIKRGIHIIDDIPLKFKLNSLQQTIKNCVLRNETYISQNLKYELTNMHPPFFYLDFESVSTAIPLYEHIAPNTQIVTQFSLDKTDNNGNILTHYEYINKKKKDCCNHIAKMLIKHLCNKSCSSIITYSNFESIYIRKLINLFPDLHYGLNNIINRMVDLELLLKRNYYNVNFHGKSSMKKVIEVISPELKYMNLDIKNGKDATIAYAFMLYGIYNKTTKQQTIKNLLKYCAMDTLAMIKIHQFLINLVK
ncbi:MAG: DUF2779 domain-containing protein [Endomicrobium sp.]|nr:DUF2779 domain-containing protein [Endomicrobium sp.]